MRGEIPEFRRRSRYLVTAVIITFGILLGRLWQVQIMKGSYYEQKCEDNFVQELRIPSVRGLIMDRKRRILATNRPRYSVYLVPRFTTPAAVERLIQELVLEPERSEKLQRRIKAAKGQRRYRPLLVHQDISRDYLARLETHKKELPGIQTVARAHREYQQANLASHVLGYMNEVSPRDLKKKKGKNYYPGELIGRFGVERMYESRLRGEPGRELIVVDARGHRKLGKEVEDLLGANRRKEPVPGQNLVLTIDMEVQRLVERALSRYKAAAAVVIEVHTGRILASASKPDFNPNILSGSLSPMDARRLLENPLKPHLDRVFRENYFPGSTYKVVPAVAALEEKLVEPDEKIVCKKIHPAGRRYPGCTHAHGKIDLHTALVESCNIYFYTVAERIGMDTLARYANRLGLGVPTGLGLNGEVGGFIPTKKWYASRKEKFRLGFTLNAVIGQGNTKTTPIQIASLYAALANGGTLYLPQIVDQVETIDGKVIQRFAPLVRSRLKLHPRTHAILRKALQGVVNDPKGTAYDSRLKELLAAGKTGTAQVSRSSRKRDHSWFAAYAPSGKPEIAVVVLIEHGGVAAKVAAPLAMQIVRNYFRYVAPRTAAASGEKTP